MPSTRHRSRAREDIGISATVPFTPATIFRLCLAIVLAAVLIPNMITAAPSQPKLPETFDVAAIDAYLTGYMQQPDRVGLSVAIVKEGQIVLQNG